MNRKAIVAGAFYPRGAGELARILEELIPQKEAKKAYGIMIPHAGYIYSGEVAGVAVGSVVIPPTVVIVCPNHSGMGASCAVWPNGEWEFPGFNTSVAQEMASEFLVSCPIAEADYTAHLREHSAEVLVPFLHFRRKDLTILPICISHLNLAGINEVGKALAELINKHPDVMLAISSDM